MNNKTKYLQVTISAETQEQANNILNSLLQKKLVTGGQILEAPARFLWKGEVTNMNYISIFSYSIEQNKRRIIDDVKVNSMEEIPMITFTEFDGNLELLDWIDKTLK